MGLREVESKQLATNVVDCVIMELFWSNLMADEFYFDGDES